MRSWLAYDEGVSCGSDAGRGHSACGSDCFGGSGDGHGVSGCLRGWSWGPEGTSGGGRCEEGESGEGGCEVHRGRGSVVVWLRKRSWWMILWLLDG